MRVKEESAKDGLKLNIQKTKIMASGFITSRQTDEETMETVTDLLFLGSKKWLWMVTAAMKLKDACSLEEKLCKPRQHIKKQRRYFADKGPSSQSYGFPSSHVWMWELDYKESWAQKNWCSWTVVLEDSWESFGQQGDQTSQFQRKSTLIIYWKDWCWCWSSSTLTTRCKQSTHWQRPCGWERLGAGGKGGGRGWDGWMASPTQWTWAWANSEIVKDREAWLRESQTWLSDWTTTSGVWGFTGGARGKEPACQCRWCKRGRFDPSVGRNPWSRKWQLIHSCLENPKDTGDGQATVQVVTKSQTQLKWLSMCTDDKISKVGGEGDNGGWDS